MKIGLFTDPHLGKTLGSHTTLESRTRLRNSLFYHARGIMEAHSDVRKWFCLGDLFDKFHNNEATLLQGAALLGKLDAVMAGNHDVVADITKLGTLEALRTLLPHAADKVFISPFGTRMFDRVTYDNCEFIFVPHHTTAELFEATLREAEELTKNREHRFLFLHCNYDMEFASNDVTLNVSAKRVEELLKTFDYVVLGHDHRPKEDFDGRLIVLGNTHPTGFGDISDKRIAIIDSETGAVSFETVWSADDGYAKVDAEELLSLQEGALLAEFIDITGTLSAGQALDFARAVKQLWNIAPYAVRANVHLQKAGQELLLPGEEEQAVSAWDLIRAELQEAGRGDLLSLMDGLKVAAAELEVEE